MDQRFSASDKRTGRRSFIASALSSGAVALWTSDVSGRSDALDSFDVCGDLSAADPLYLYQSLVWRLQPDATRACRQVENQVVTSLSAKMEELWKASAKLKSTLFPQSRLGTAVERMNSLAYIGHTNAQAVKSSLNIPSPEIARAHLKSQHVITFEIVKASFELSHQGGKTLNANEWELLQQILTLIDQIKTIQYPNLIKARTEFDECLSRISKTIADIQNALTKSSTSVVRGNKPEALRQLNCALKQLDQLPMSPVELENAPKDLDSSRIVDESFKEPEFLTRDLFKKMLEPIRDLISGTHPIPRISNKYKEGSPVTPVAYVSPSTISFPNGLVDPMSVREIVRDCFISGHWLQVVGVTAACLPLWSAYSKSEERKVLIHSALCAVPRGKSKLWEAAYYLNNLT